MRTNLRGRKTSREDFYISDNIFYFTLGSCPLCLEKVV